MKSQMRLGALTGALCAALACATGALAAPAHSEPTPTELQAARDLFAKAEADEQASRWADALDKLQRAFSVKATAGLRFHIAHCEEKLGRLVAALADYTAADQMAHDKNNDDVISAVAEPLRNLRMRVPTLTIEVPSAPGSRVELDGTAVSPGLYGVAMPVEPGNHRVVAHAAGKLDFSTDVHLDERQAQTAIVQWREAEAPSSLLEGRRNLEQLEKHMPSPQAAQKPSKAGAIVTTVLSASLLGFGIGAYLAADGAQSTLVQKCPQQLLYCDDLRAPVHTWDALALAGFLAAGATATVAVVLWVLPVKSAKAMARIELRPFGAALVGDF